MDEEKVRELVFYLASYVEGHVTEGELVSRLAELPQEVTDFLPDYRPDMQEGLPLKLRVNELRAAIERGETFIVRSVC